MPKFVLMGFPSYNIAAPEPQYNSFGVDEEGAYRKIGGYPSAYYGRKGGTNLGSDFRYKDR